MWRMAIERHLQSIHGLNHYMTLAVFKLCILYTLTEGHPTVLLTGAKRKSIMPSTKIWYWAKPHKVEWTWATLPRHLFQSVQPIGDADLWQSGQCPGGPRSSLCNTMRLPVLSLISAPHLRYITEFQCNRSHTCLLVKEGPEKQMRKKLSISWMICNLYQG